MKNLKRFITITVCMLFIVVAFAQKPNIHILATGGTIAGAGNSSVSGHYKPGEVAIASIIEAVPQLKNIANITGEQFANMASQNMTNFIWLRLAKRVNELLKSPDCDGVVITHGTDTMEETAYFLNLTVNSDKPVVIVGSMNPSTSVSPDGPLNLYNAVLVAGSPKSKGLGAFIVMNGSIVSASNALKINTVRIHTFQTPNGGEIGYVENGNVVYKFKPLKKHTINSDFNIEDINELPKVGIVYGYAGIQADMVSHMLNEDYKGIVYAGVGNGNFHKNIFPDMIKAQNQGIQVVRSSRVVTGPTTLDSEIDDAKYHFVASQELDAQKARILLMLALTKTSDWNKIQEYFMEY